MGLGSWAAAFIIGVYQSLSCASQIVSEYSDRSQGKSFCELTDLVVSTDGVYRFYDKVTCHLSNDLNLHLYQKDNRYLLEVKGLSRNIYSGKINSEQPLESFKKCSQLSPAIKKWNKFTRKSLPASSVRNFINSESVLLVASEFTCQQNESELQQLLDHFKKEGRVKSDLICIDQTIVNQVNPSLIRSSILERAEITDGIILVGTDIPPFEYYTSQQSDESDSYRYGSTDLPYGDLDSLFWSQPQSKLDPEIFNKVYKQSNSIHSTYSPTSFTYHLNEWGLSYEQPLKNRLRWVSRLVGPDHFLQFFSNRRVHYLPPTEHRYLHARGGSGILFVPQDSESLPRLQAMLKPFTDVLPVGSQTRLVTEAHLFGMSRLIDRSTTLMSYDEHGTSISIGDFKSSRIDEINWMPPLLQLESCSTGSWYDAHDIKSSFIMKLFGLPSPPLVILASQGIKWLPTMGTEDSITKDVFFNHFVPGQSFGSRQIEAFVKNIDHWRALQDSDLSFPVQLYHSLSLFGDGSIEF